MLAGFGVGFGGFIFAGAVVAQGAAALEDFTFQEKAGAHQKTAHD